MGLISRVSSRTYRSSMKIIPGETPKMLTNFEVHEVIKDTLAVKRGAKRDPNLQKILKTTAKHFENKEAIAASSVENLKNVGEICSRYKLTKAETVQLINMRPTDVLHLHMIIEELDTRIPEEEHQEKLLTEIQAAMPIASLMEDE